MAGHWFSSESPDSQLTLPRADRAVGYAASCTLTPRHSQQEHEAWAGSGQHEGKARPDFRLCSEWTSEAAASTAISQCCALEMPEHGFCCRKTFSSPTWPFYSFLPLLPKRPSELLPQRTCYRGPLVHITCSRVAVVVSALLLWCCPCGLRAEPWGHWQWCRGVCGLLGTHIYSVRPQLFSAPRACKTPGEEERADRFQAGVSFHGAHLRNSICPCPVSETDSK